MPAQAGIQYAEASRWITAVSGMRDRPPEPVIGLAEGETRWRAMTAEYLVDGRVKARP
jgi:hypothetical protein